MNSLEIIDTVIDTNQVDLNRATRVVQRAHTQLIDQSHVNEVSDSSKSILAAATTVDLTSLSVNGDRIIQVWIDNQSILETFRPIGESDPEVDGLRWEFNTATKIMTFNATADVLTAVTIVYVKKAKTLAYVTTDSPEFEMDEIILQAVDLILGGGGFSTWLNGEGVDQMRDYFGNGKRSRSVGTFDTSSFL